MPLLIDLKPIIRVPRSQRLPIEERFAEFHRLNPQVAETLRIMALDMIRRGVRQWSTKAAFEILRWQYALQTRGSSYKLDNSLTSSYARFLMDREPRLAGFFETRVMKSRERRR